MPGYAYDYSLTPERSGWRSALTGFLTVVAVVAISTISGAVVTLELLAPSSQSNTRVASDAPKIVASAPQQTIQPQASSQQTASAPQSAQAAAPSVAPRAAASTDTVASIQTQQAPSRAPAAAQPSPQAAATIAANTAPASTVAAAPERAEVADSELTFSKGYARRHAAAAKAAVGNSRLAGVGVAAGEFGRTAVKVAKAKPRSQTVAIQDRQDPRRPDAYYSANRYAFGDSSRQQQQQQQHRGFGFFDRLF
jgi:hypothetical protein